MDQAFEHVAGPLDSGSTTSAILSACVDPFFDARKEILENKLRELLRPFKEGYALPLDDDFQEAMDLRTSDRGSLAVTGNISDASQPSRSAPSHRSTEFGIRRTFETTQTFYDVRINAFSKFSVEILTDWIGRRWLCARSLIT